MMHNSRFAPPDVLFLHGLLGVPGHWQPIADALRPHYHSHLLDLELFDWPLAETAMDPLVDRVVAWLDNRGVDRFVAVGNSLGGQVALHLALRQPERVAGLLLAGSSGLMERQFETAPRRPSHAWIRDHVEEIFYEPQHATEALVDRVIAVLEDRESARRLVRLARSSKQDTVGRHLERITCPVALVWGEDDVVTPPAVAHEFHRRLPNADLALIPRCGHVPMLEYPDLFGDTLTQFLSTGRLGRAGDPAHALGEHGGLKLGCSPAAR